MDTILTRYRQKKAALERLLSQSELFETTLGMVEAAQIGQGSAVLISHGSGGGYDMGLWLARLVGGPYQYIAPSRFGYLRSPRPADQKPEAQADLYAALLDLLKSTPSSSSDFRVAAHPRFNLPCAIPSAAADSF